MAVFDIHTDPAHNRMLVRLDGYVSPSEARRVSASVLREATRLSPGFMLVQDTSGARGSSDLGELVEQLRGLGLGHVVKVLASADDLGARELSDEVLMELTGS